MKHAELTNKILECCFEVMNELGVGFLESVYEKSLLVALRQKGLIAKSQFPMEVEFRGETVGEFYADIFVEDRIIVELKVSKSLAPQHSAQVINYLKATGCEVGLLINFGKPKIEYKRLYFAQ